LVYDPEARSAPADLANHPYLNRLETVTQPATTTTPTPSKPMEESDGVTITNGHSEAPVDPSHSTALQMDTNPATQQVEMTTDSSTGPDSAQIQQQ
jgi:hypothetical protein